MLAEIGIGIAVGVYKSQVKEIVRTELRKVVDRYDYVPTFVTRDILRPNSSASWDPNTVKETATLNTLQAWVKTESNRNGSIPVSVVLPFDGVSWVF